MTQITIRNVVPADLEACFLVEVSGFPEEEAASKETIRLRIDMVVVFYKHLLVGCL